MELTAAEVAVRLAIAGAIGLVVGTEREWSGPPEGPKRRFAGIRTFFLLGLLGGVSGITMLSGYLAIAVILCGSATALILTEYYVGTRRNESPLSGTTEAAAIVVLALGVFAALGYLWPAAGCGAAVVFALGEKDRLHWLVRRIGATEMHGGLEFLVLALVILPLLPMDPLFGLDAFRPRAIWIMVLVLLAIDFIGYLARRSVGADRGYGVTGAVAGLVSSTALTLHFSRLSRLEPEHSRGLSIGIVAACVVLPLRVMLIATAISPRVGAVLLWYLMPSLLVTAVILFIITRQATAVSTDHPSIGAKDGARSPLRLGNAMVMAGLFAVVLVSVDLAQERWGESGVVGSGILFGLTDLDALTLSMSRMAAAGTDLAELAARGIAIGVIANSIVKSGIATLLGTATLRRATLTALGCGMIPLMLVLWWRW